MHVIVSDKTLASECCHVAYLVILDACEFLYPFSNCLLV